MIDAARATGEVIPTLCWLYLADAGVWIMGPVQNIIVFSAIVFNIHFWFLKHSAFFVLLNVALQQQPSRSDPVVEINVIVYIFTGSFHSVVSLTHPGPCALYILTTISMMGFHPDPSVDLTYLRQTKRLRYWRIKHVRTVSRSVLM